MIQRVALIVGWVVLVFITFATLTPIQGRPRLAGLQLEHFAAFAVMGFAFAFGITRRTWAVLAMVILSALALEGMQLLTPDSAWSDSRRRSEGHRRSLRSRRRPFSPDLAASDRYPDFAIRETSSVRARGIRGECPCIVARALPFPQAFLLIPHDRG